MIYNPPMPKTRLDPHGNVLHRRMHYKGGGYYHVARNVWTFLGRAYATALAAWARIEGGGLQPRTVAEAWALFKGDEDGLAMLASSTRRNYTNAMEREGGMLAVYGAMGLDDVRRSHMRAHLKARRQADHAVAGNRDVAALASLFRYCRENDWTENHPTQVKRNPEHARKRVATAGERSAMNLSMPTLWRCIIVVALVTGMRSSEIRLLRRDQLHDDAVRPQRMKGAKGKPYEWSPLLRQAIETALALQPPSRPSIYVFPGPNTSGQPYTDGGFSTMWKKYFKRAGIEGLTFHDLRRTAGNDAARTVDLKYAQELLGHETDATTHRHYTPDVPVRPLG